MMKISNISTLIDGREYYGDILIEAFTAQEVRFRHKTRRGGWSAYQHTMSRSKIPLECDIALHDWLMRSGGDVRC